MGILFDYRRILHIMLKVVSDVLIGKLNDTSALLGMYIELLNCLGFEENR